jgi:hypothetical protein
MESSAFWSGFDKTLRFAEPVGTTSVPPQAWCGARAADESDRTSARWWYAA